MASQNQIQTSEQSQFCVPAEIVVDILLKLPSKSLLRCRVVCKLWHSLISDPYFVNSKYLSSTSSSTTTNIDRHRLIFNYRWRGNLIVCNLYDALYDKSVSNKALTIGKSNPSSECEVIASCNGLVCFYDEVYDKSLYIWNPSTRICKWLSPFYGFSCVYGFGYDESTDDYKLLAVYKARYSWDTKLYSLKTGKWKTIGDFPYGMSMRDGEGKYSNGALHWVGKYGACMIVSFHLATETYGQVLQPEYGDEHNNFLLSLGALGEELGMLCYYYGSHSDIWVMKVYGVKESWTKLFSIKYMPDRRIIIGFRMPLFISNDGKILFEYCRKLFVYDTKNGSSFEIQNFELYGKACTFVESLVSPMPTDIDDPKQNPDIGTIRSFGSN